MHKFVGVLDKYEPTQPEINLEINIETTWSKVSCIRKCHDGRDLNCGQTREICKS